MRHRLLVVHFLLSIAFSVDAQAAASFFMAQGGTSRAVKKLAKEASIQLRKLSILNDRYIAFYLIYKDILSLWF